jgi:hypothetical protein
MILSEKDAAAIWLQIRSRTEGQVGSLILREVEAGALRQVRDQLCDQISDQVIDRVARQIIYHFYDFN